jgi:hypothetical protein
MRSDTFLRLTQLHSLLADTKETGRYYRHAVTGRPGVPRSSSRYFFVLESLSPPFSAYDTAYGKFHTGPLPSVPHLLHSLLAPLTRIVERVTPLTPQLRLPHLPYPCPSSSNAVG